MSKIYDPLDTCASGIRGYTGQALSLVVLSSLRYSPVVLPLSGVIRWLVVRCSQRGLDVAKYPACEFLEGGGMSHESQGE